MLIVEKLNFHGFIPENTFLKEDRKALTEANLLAPHPDLDDQLCWEFEATHEKVKDRLSKLDLREFDYIYQRLTTSHDILRALLTNDEKELIEVCKGYFFRAFKRYKVQHFAGKIPPGFPKHDPDELFHDFILSISENKYGNFNGFLQYALDENWDDGRFIRYFERFFMTRWGSRSSCDNDYQTNQLYHTVRKIFYNQTALDFKFERVSIDTETRFYSEKIPSPKDSFPLSADQRLEQIKQRALRLRSQLPSTLFYRKSHQKTAHFQLHVPDIKPIVRVLLEQCEHAVTIEDFIGFLCEHYGIAPFINSSLELMMEESPGTELKISKNSGANPELEYLKDEQSKRACDEINQFITSEISLVMETLDRIELNDNKFTAYAKKAPPVSNRQQLESIKMMGIIYVLLYFTAGWENSNEQEQYTADFFNEFHDKQIAPDCFSEAKIEDPLKNIFNLKRTRFFKIKNLVTEKFGFQPFDGKTDETFELFRSSPIYCVAFDSC